MGLGVDHCWAVRSRNWGMLAGARDVSRLITSVGMAAASVR